MFYATTPFHSRGVPRVLFRMFNAEFEGAQHRRSDVAGWASRGCATLRQSREVESAEYISTAALEAHWSLFLLAYTSQA